MARSFCVLAFVVFVLAPISIQAQPKGGPKLTLDEIDQAVEKSLKTMQGFWIRDNVEQNGRGPYWTPRYDAIYIEKSHLQSATKAGQLGVDGAGFRIDPTKSPMAIDYKYRNGKYMGIYKVEGKRLVLAFKQADDRAGLFSVAGDAGPGRSTVVLTFKQDAPPKLLEPKNDGLKLTQDQIDQAVEESTKKLQGLWILDLAEQNGQGPYWTPRYDAIVIEKSNLQSARKTGELGADGAGFRIDPTKNPPTIDFNYRNNKYMAVYKVEGNRLYLGFKAADFRPVQFTTDLSAGVERSVVLLTFKKK